MAGKSPDHFLGTTERRIGIEHGRRDHAARR
jgi:hypothetical protein